MTVTPFAVEHPSGAPAYALRVECDGRVVAYSGDTEWTDALVRAAAGADLLICEAYFFDRKVKYHLDYQLIVDHRDRLECGRIILTHMSADMLGHDDAEFERAHDGLLVTL